MKVSETYALTLEQLLVVLVENVPKMHKPFHFMCLKAILGVLLALQTKGNTFSKVLAGFGELFVSQFLGYSTLHSCEPLLDFPEFFRFLTVWLDFLISFVIFYSLEIWCSERERKGKVLYSPVFDFNSSSSKQTWLFLWHVCSVLVCLQEKLQDVGVIKYWWYQQLNKQKQTKNCKNKMCQQFSFNDLPPPHPHFRVQTWDNYAFCKVSWCIINIPYCEGWNGMG